MRTKNMLKVLYKEYAWNVKGIYKEYSVLKQSRKSPEHVLNKSWNIDTYIYIYDQIIIFQFLNVNLKYVNFINAKLFFLLISGQRHVVLVGWSEGIRGRRGC